MFNKHGVKICQEKKTEKLKTVVTSDPSSLTQKKRKVVFINLLRVTDKVLDYYRWHVRDSSHLLRIDVQKKLTRNMHLATAYKRDPDDYPNPRVFYAYGNMRFGVRNNRVFWIENRREKLPMWRLDIEKKRKLNEVLQIKD